MLGTVSLGFTEAWSRQIQDSVCNSRNSSILLLFPLPDERKRENESTNSDGSIFSTKKHGRGKLNIPFCNTRNFFILLLFSIARWKKGTSIHNPEETLHSSKHA